MGSASLPELGFIPKNPSPGQRRRSGSDAVLAASLPECFFHHSHAQPSILAWAQDCSLGPAPEVRQRGCPCSIADRVFFHHSHALPSILLWQQDCSTQSCCGNRIAPPNPAVATGLLHPILLWQQDCSTQSCCGNRIAPVHYEQLGLGTVLPRSLTLTTKGRPLAKSASRSSV